MTDESEIGAFFELLSAAKWWVLAIALVAALVAGAFGWSGWTYESSVPVRVQFPANLTRAPSPDRFIQLAKSPAVVQGAASDAGVTGELPLIRETLGAAISSADPRIVTISVRLETSSKAKAFLGALVSRARSESMKGIADQIAGLKESRATAAALSKQVTKVVAAGEQVRRRLRAVSGMSAGERLIAEVELLQMNISAVQSRTSLTAATSELDADLESLNKAVVVDGAVSIRAVSPVSGVTGYALRGLIVGLVVAILALFVPPIRRKLTS